MVGGSPRKSGCPRERVRRRRFWNICRIASATAPLAATHPVFASHGYACIRVDIAGTGESDGVFDDEYSERELSDGEEAVAPETRHSILTFAFQLHRIIL